MKGLTIRLLPWGAAAAVFCFLAYFLVKLLPGVQAVEIDMEIDHPDQLRVYHSLSRDFRETAATTAQTIPTQRGKVKVLLTGSFAGYLRLDTGGQPGKTKIYTVRVSSYFHPPLDFGPEDLVERFAASPDAVLTARGDHLEVFSRGNDPYLFSTARLYRKMYVPACLISLGFALLAFVLLRQWLRSEKSDGLAAPLSAAAGERFDALDGLRGLAAMMVIADHTWGWFRGVGASGVWIFFALSGFLLARPFIDRPGLVLSPSYMAGYLRRRFVRILPMYYAYIFVVYAVPGRINLALAHGVFLQGDGHLWALPQEVLFYLLWPVAVLLLLPLARSTLATLAALLAVIFLWNRYVDIGVFWLLGMDHVRLPLFFGVFLAGVWFSFAQARLAPLLAHGDRQRMAGRVAAVLVVLILLLFLLLSTGNLLGVRAVYSQKYFGLYGMLAGLLVAATVVAKTSLVHRFLTLAALRELGRVGLSLYLVHPVVKGLVDMVTMSYFGGKLRNLPLFLTTLGLSYLLARYTFRHIEQPTLIGRP